MHSTFFIFTLAAVLVACSAYTPMRPDGDFAQPIADTQEGKYEGGLVFLSGNVLLHNLKQLFPTVI